MISKRTDKPQLSILFLFSVLFFFYLCWRNIGVAAVVLSMYGFLNDAPSKGYERTGSMSFIAKENFPFLAGLPKPYLLIIDRNGRMEDHVISDENDLKALSK